MMIYMTPPSLPCGCARALASLQSDINSIRPSRKPSCLLPIDLNLSLSNPLLPLSSHSRPASLHSSSRDI